MWNKDYIEKIKMDLIIADYKSGNSWDNKIFKIKVFENLDKVLYYNVLELFEEIIKQNTLNDMEE